MTLTIGRAVALALVAGLAACTDRASDVGDRADRRRPGAPPADAKPARSDPRTQHDLARALTEVESSRDPEAVALGYQKIRSSWTGRRYRWRVRVIEPLCRSRDACNVLPFDRAGRDKAAVHGWMPRLVLDDRGFAAIERACAGAASCEIDIEGTLSQFIVDTEDPTSLEFRDVRVL